METRGELHAWVGRMWLNPSYNAEMMLKFFKKGIQEYENGNVTEAIIHANTLDTQSDWFQALGELSTAICIVRGRIKWVAAHKFVSDLLSKLGIIWNPTYTRHGSVFFYWGEQPSKFNTVFTRFGVCYRR